ncbi:hypothetical protein Taro_031123 [Colocasia esculenta]|uniref:Myb/SANT-like domain-containing protein n=1 Tax=Colocasia esculenta TaxID=4460 RepID=A0A843VI25_COLES|nr:hypothetical protein [Colocasia esculenta]
MKLVSIVGLLLFKGLTSYAGISTTPPLKEQMDKDCLKNRWRNIKKIYHIYKQLRTRSGWGWDDERNLPVAPDEESIQVAIACI